MGAVMCTLTDGVGFAWANPTKVRQPLIACEITLFTVSCILLAIALTGTSSDPAVIKAMPWVNIVVTYEQQTNGETRQGTGYSNLRYTCEELPEGTLRDCVGLVTGRDCMSWADRLEYEHSACWPKSWR